MMLFRCYFLFLGWLIISSVSIAQEPRLSIIPEPQEVILYESDFEINLETKIVLGEGSDEADIFTAGQLTERLQELAGIQLEVLKESEVSNWSKIVFFGKLDQSPKAREMANRGNFTALMEIGQEGYFLQSSDSLVVITANTSQGLYYGCMTLGQLVHKEGDKLYVSGVTIYDWPAYQFRGISEDMSQGQIPKFEYFKKIVRFLGQYKMNTYMLYVNDMFQFEHHPKIAEGQGALTKSEVVELEAFANKYHVQIIPVFDAFAGMENILLLPEYRFLAEFPGAASLAPAKEETYQLLDELIFEISEAFSSPYLHIGGHGVRHLGGGQDSKNLVQNNDLAVVYARHYKRVSEIVRNYNKQVMMLGDMIVSSPTILYQIPEDVIFVHCQNQAWETHPSVENFSWAGRRFLVSPSLWNGRRIFPDYLEAFSNIRNLLQSGVEAGALGAITATCNDLASAAFGEYNWYGYAFAAECSWSPKSVSIAKFNKKFFPQFFGNDTLEPELIYTLLMELADQALWQKLWRHPFLPATESNHIPLKGVHKLKTQMSQVMQLIDSFSKIAIRNKDNLDYLKFAAEQGAWIAKKYEIVKDVRQFCENFYKEEGDREVNRIIDKCLEMVEDLNQILENLQLLWLRNYHKEGLPLLVNLYGYQIDYWQEKIEQIQRGHLSESPVLASQWVYHPSIEFGGSEQSVPHAYFRKTFEILPGFKKAYLQAIADSHLKVYLNGGFLDEVIDSETHSLKVESQRVKMWDISALLQPGKNVIAVEAWNYVPNRSAGLNIYGEIQYELGKTIKLKSDSYWKVSTDEENNWRKLGFFDVQWLNAVPSKRDLVVTEPSFDTGRPSRIEW
ncbi:MAG: glycoside hydrolase family 20 zincin-like fold domain-containing protein [bacterium]